MPKKNGFTIVELAIVLLVVALLLGGLMMGLSGQIEQRRVSDTQKALDDIKEALIGYAASQSPPHLPCPDMATALPPPPSPGISPNDGLEDRLASGACANQEGNIPWATLGVADVDAWGRRFHYKVTSAYSNIPPSVVNTFALTSTGTLSVCKSSPNPVGLACNPVNTTIAAKLPAVILSYGKNGRGAIISAGAQIANPPPPVPPAVNSDEFENTNQDNIFVSRPPSEAGGTLGEFDDQVAWLTSNILNSRMISAQKLP